MFMLRTVVKNLKNSTNSIPTHLSATKKKTQIMRYKRDKQIFTLPVIDSRLKTMCKQNHVHRWFLGDMYQKFTILKIICKQTKTFTSRF